MADAYTELEALYAKVSDIVGTVDDVFRTVRNQPINIDITADLAEMCGGSRTAAKRRASSAFSHLTDAQSHLDNAAEAVADARADLRRLIDQARP